MSQRVDRGIVRRCVVCVLSFAILAIGSRCVAVISSARADEARSAAVAADRPLLAVSCWSTRACTAVGGLFAERWNGLQWSVHGVAIPASSDAQRSFHDGISCAAKRLCMAVGTAYPSLSANVEYDYSALAEIWDGSTWSDQSPGLGQTRNGFFQAVSCPSVSRCIAVGQRGTSALAMGWHGRRWRVQLARVGRAVMSVLNGVFCTSATRCVAVGYTQAAPSAPFQVLIESWNGAVWSPVPTARTSGLQSAVLNAVSCTRRWCTAVGSIGAQQLVERWDGRTWSIQRNPSGVPAAGLNGVSCVSTVDCVAVGGETKRPYQAVAERWNRGRWTIERTPTSAKASILWGVSCVSPSDCVAAGERAQTPLIERSKGATWSIQTLVQPAL